ncbi:MAG: MBL fold metallo-hydrolase [bacterium]
MAAQVMLSIASRFRVGTAILHVGSAQFTPSGPIRYTFNGVEAARTAKALQARRIIPIHYEGWSHFREGRPEIEKAFAEQRLADRLHWLPAGEAVEVEV